MTKQAKQITKLIAADIHKRFNDRVISLVHFGTSRTERMYGDIDLELLLDKPDQFDLLKINKILHRYNIKLDFHVCYQSQLSYQKSFRRKAQGSYLLFSLAKGNLLLGKSNFFQDLLTKIQPEEIKKDIYIKNQEYQYSIREFLLERNFLEKRIKFCKYLFRYLSQLFVLKNLLNYKQILTLNQKEIIAIFATSNIFIKSERILIRNLYSNKQYTQDELIIAVAQILSVTDGLMDDLYEEIYD